MVEQSLLKEDKPCRKSLKVEPRGGAPGSSASGKLCTRVDTTSHIVYSSLHILNTSGHWQFTLCLPIPPSTITILLKLEVFHVCECACVRVHECMHACMRECACINAGVCLCIFGE